MIIGPPVRFEINVLQPDDIINDKKSKTYNPTIGYYKLIKIPNSTFSGNWLTLLDYLGLLL